MPDEHGGLARAVSELGDVQQQDWAKAAIDHLQPEDHHHQEHEVLERENRSERDAAAFARLPGCARDGSVYINVTIRNAPA